VEERLREQEAEGVQMPVGMEPDELALRILILTLLTPPDYWGCGAQVRPQVRSDWHLQVAPNF
jgi:hypothetical protein